MNQPLFAQCTLESGDSRLICFLETTKIKSGMKVTLEDSENPKRWWTIISMGIPIPQKQIKDSHYSKNWFKNDYRRKLEGLRINE